MMTTMTVMAVPKRVLGNPVFNQAITEKQVQSVTADSTKSGQDKPDNDASWVGVGLTSATACRWNCDSGYKPNSDSTACEYSESIDSFTITGLTTIGSKEVSGSRTVNFTLKGTDVSKWYVTHVPPTTFR